MRQLKIRTIGDIIKVSEVCIRTALDGGAGLGETAKEIIGACPEIKRIECFEPFLGNHKFWTESDSRIRLWKSALDGAAGRSSFYVPATVGEGVTDWEERVGYSSLGYLKPIDLILRVKRVVDHLLGRPQHWYWVDTVRADEAIDRAPEFLKLDLQGGELSALRGMTKWLTSVHIAWIEYSGARAVKNLLLKNGFKLFSTTLVIADQWGYWHENHLNLIEEKQSSTNRVFRFAWLKEDWKDFDVQFEEMKPYGLIQTDLVALNTRFFDTANIERIQQKIQEY